MITPPVTNLSQYGLIVDTAPAAIPQNAFSDGRNIRFSNGAVSKMTGEVLLNNITDATDLDTIYTGTGNKFGSAKYIAYWPNPNLGDLYGYYIYVMEILSSTNVPLAHRVYLQDQSGTTVDITPTGLTNSGSVSGFDTTGNWQHTLFSGGFTFIINNGIQKPHALKDETTDQSVSNLGKLFELPGWDSYNIEQEVYNDNWYATFGYDFDLGQKVDFTEYRIHVKVHNSTTTFTSATTTSNITVALNAASNTHKVTLNSNSISDGQSLQIIIESLNTVQVRCQVIRSFGELLVAGDLTETDTSTGTVVRKLAGVIRTSDLALPGSLPANWNPFATGVSTADEVILSDTNIIKDMVSIQGALYIYTTNSIHVMRLTGNADVPVSFNPVTDQYGALSIESVIEFDGKHFVIGNNDIYIFPGHPANIESAADSRVRQYFFDNLSPLHESNLFTMLNIAEDEIWICYPTVNSITGECDEALIWNYRDSTWTKRDLYGVVSGDVSPVRGGGIPQAEIQPTAGESGNDTAMNTGRNEVQTLTVDGEIYAPHTGIPQIQRNTLPTISSYTAAGYDQIAITFSGDAGEDTTFASHSITFPDAALFTRSSTTGGGFQLFYTHTNNTTANAMTINGSALFPVNDGLSKTGTEIAAAFATYINNITASSDPLFGYTATASGQTTTFVSNLVGVRNISNFSAASYSGTTTATTGDGTNEGVAVTTSVVNLAAAQAQTVPGTGAPHAVPYYDTTFNWSNFGTTSVSTLDGITTPKDNVNGLQAVVGGWTSAGAGGSDGRTRVDTYTVGQTGNLHFILSGSGGSGADHNHGGGAASAATGTIAAQAGDTVEMTAGRAGRRDTYSGSGTAGASSRIRWYRGTTLLADITAPGGRAASNGSTATAAAQVTPLTAPSGVSNYTTFRGEGSTSQVLSGEGNRGGNRNGGRGFFTLNGGGSQYRGRWSPSSLNWQPSERAWGDGTQSHSDSPRCCTWNASTPGIVFLWQEPVKTEYTITNNRTETTHPLQTTLFNLHLAEAGSDTSQDISQLDAGESATASFVGSTTNTNWSATMLGTTTDTIDAEVGDHQGATVAGSSIQVQRVTAPAPYPKSITYTKIRGNYGSPPVGTKTFSKSSFSYTWHNRTFYGNQTTFGTSMVRETDEQIGIVEAENCTAGTLMWKWAGGINGYVQNPYYFTLKVTGRHRTSANGTFLSGSHYYTFSTPRSTANYGSTTYKAKRYTSNPGNPNSTSVAGSGTAVESNILGIYDLRNCSIRLYFNAYQPGTSSASFAFRWNGNATDDGYKWQARKIANSGPATITHANGNITPDVVLTETYQDISAGTRFESINIKGPYTVSTGSSASVTMTGANILPGIGYYGITAAESPPISAKLTQAATSNVKALDIQVSEFVEDTVLPSDFSDHVIEELLNYTEFRGKDPGTPGTIQPIGALYHTVKQTGGDAIILTRVPIVAGSLINITYTGTSANGPNTYTNIQQTSTSGSGSGATFDVDTDDAGNYLVVFQDDAQENLPGSGYAVNDTITIAGTSLGGASPANDLVLTVTEVMPGSTNDGSISFSFVTEKDGVIYPENTFGGNLSSTLSVTAASAGNVTAPVVRQSFDGTNVDTILFGTNDQDTIASKLALALNATASWTANSTNEVINATRTTGGPSTNFIQLSIVSDPSGVLPAGFVSTYAEVQAGSNTSTGNADYVVTLPATQFADAISVTVPMTGALNARLSESDIATLLRAASYPGWTTSGENNNVIWTSNAPTTANRLDDGYGTGAIQNKRFLATPDDKSGVFRYSLDPAVAVTAVETTAGIAIRYSEPTCYRFSFSNDDTLDFVFGGTYNGVLAANTQFVPDIYTGGSSSTRVPIATVSTKLLEGLASFAGQRLKTLRDGSNQKVTASPVQYSQDGLWVTSIEVISRGTVAPTSLAVAIPTSVTNADLAETILVINAFDVDRPWPISQVKRGRKYPIFIQTTTNNAGVVTNNRIRAADIGYKIGADPYNNIGGTPYVSFVEKRDLPISPEFDVEEVSSVALWADGGTQTVLGGAINRATFNLRMSAANNTAELVDIDRAPQITNQFTVGSDYKIDTRITGRFSSFRIDDGDINPDIQEGEEEVININAWNISSYQLDIKKGGER